MLITSDTIAIFNGINDKRSIYFLWDTSCIIFDG